MCSQRPLDASELQIKFLIEERGEFQRGRLCLRLADTAMKCLGVEIKPSMLSQENFAVLVFGNRENSPIGPYLLEDVEGQYVIRE